jgi:hypothetical protein
MFSHYEQGRAEDSDVTAINYQLVPFSQTMWDYKVVTCPTHSFELPGMKLS